MVLAAIFLLIDYFRYSNKYYIKEMFSEKIIITSFKVIGFSISMFALASVASGSIAGIKEAGHYFERIIPFLVILVLLYKREYTIQPLMMGSYLGVAIVAVTVISDYIFCGVGRPSGILGQPNKLGGWVILVLPFVISCTYYFRDNMYKKLCGILVAGFALFVLFLSGSRGAVLGLVVMTIMGTLIYLRAKVRNILVMLLTLLILFIVLYQCGMNGFQRPYDSERLLLWDSGIKMFLDYPLFGVGWNNWGSVYRELYMSSLAKEPNLVSPHNIILHYLDTVGVVGVSGIILLFGSQLYYLSKNLYVNNKINIFALSMFLCVIGTLVHGMVDIIFLNRFYMILYGFIWGVTCCEILKKREFAITK
jgi:O-antigen polymerase